MVLIGGVARIFDLNMVPEAVSKVLEPMNGVYGGPIDGSWGNGGWKQGVWVFI